METILVLQVALILYIKYDLEHQDANHEEIKHKIIYFMFYHLHHRGIFIQIHHLLHRLHHHQNQFQMVYNRCCYHHLLHHQNK